jgi:uncharacterized protein (DUF736 family)|tara:strand:- start:1696 stop:1995 length:300 start_codon:yes stop_codon:yes gene_type:complete
MNNTDTDTDTKTNEWRERELGALWLKQGRSSKDYMTGHCSIDDKKVSVVVFKNTKKTSDRAPDYVIYKHKERDTEEGSPQNSAEGSPQNSEEEVPALLA